MDFRYSVEQDIMRRIARDFAENEIAPYATAWDKNHAYPREIKSRMRAAGLLSLGIPTEYGGAGLDHVSQNLVTEEIARGDAGIAIALAASSWLGSHPVLLAAGHEQKKWWYGMELEGCLAALCLNGADANVDHSVMEVSCKRCGNEYILQGHHQSVNNGAGAGLYTVFASLDNRPGARGTCAFMVERNSGGIRVESVRQPGMRGSDNATVIYDDVRVPALNLLGKEGDGVKLATQTLGIARVTAAAAAVGIAQAVFETVVQYALQRYQFGKPIFELPEIHLWLTDMARLIEAGRFSHLTAANILDGGLVDEAAVYQTRCLCSDTAIKAALEALQIFGGPGWVEEWPVEKYGRDARTLEDWQEQPRLRKNLSPAI